MQSLACTCSKVAVALGFFLPLYANAAQPSWFDTVSKYPDNDNVEMLLYEVIALANPNLVDGSGKSILATHYLRLIKSGLSPNDAAISILNPNYSKFFESTEDLKLQRKYVLYKFSAESNDYYTAKSIHDALSNQYKDAFSLTPDIDHMLQNPLGLTIDATLDVLKYSGDNRVEKGKFFNLPLAIKYFDQSDFEKARKYLTEWSQIVDDALRNCAAIEETIILNLIVNRQLQFENGVLEKLKAYARANGYSNLVEKIKFQIEFRENKPKAEQDFDEIESCLTSNRPIPLDTLAKDRSYQFAKLQTSPKIYGYIKNACFTPSQKPDCRTGFDAVVESLVLSAAYDHQKLKDAIDYLEYEARTIKFKYDQADWAYPPKPVTFDLVGQFVKACKLEDFSFFTDLSYNDNLKNWIRKVLTWSTSTFDEKASPPLSNHLPAPHTSASAKYENLIIDLLQNDACKDAEERRKIDNRLLADLYARTPNSEKVNRKLLIEEKCHGVAEPAIYKTSDIVFIRLYIKLRKNEADNDEIQQLVSTQGWNSILETQDDLKTTIESIDKPEILYLIAQTIGPSLNQMPNLKQIMKDTLYSRISLDKQVQDAEVLLRTLALKDVARAELTSHSCPNIVAEYLKLFCKLKSDDETAREAIEHIISIKNNCREIFDFACIPGTQGPLPASRQQTASKSHSTNGSQTEASTSTSEMASSSKANSTSKASSSLPYSKASDPNISNDEASAHIGEQRSESESGTSRTQSIRKALFSNIVDSTAKNLVSEYSDIQVSLAHELISSAKSIDQITLAIKFISDCTEKLGKETIEMAFKKAKTLEQFDMLFQGHLRTDAYDKIKHWKMALNAFGKSLSNKDYIVATGLQKAIQRRPKLGLAEYEAATLHLFPSNTSCPKPCAGYIESAKKLTSMLLDSLDSYEPALTHIFSMANNASSEISWVPVLVLAKKMAERKNFATEAYKAMVLEARLNPRSVETRQLVVEYAKQAGIEGRYGVIALLIGIDDQEITAIAKSNVPSNVYEQATRQLVYKLSNDLNEIELIMDPNGKEETKRNTMETPLPPDKSIKMYADPEYFVDTADLATPVKHCSHLSVRHLEKFGLTLEFSCVSLVQANVFKEFAKLETWWKLLNLNIFKYMTRTMLSYIDIRDLAELPNQMLFILGENVSVYNEEHPCKLFEQQAYYEWLSINNKLASVSKGCMEAMGPQWHTVVQDAIGNNNTNHAREMLKTVTCKDITTDAKRSFQHLSLPPSLWKVFGERVYSLNKHPCAAFTVDDANKMADFLESTTEACLLSGSDDMALVERMGPNELDSILPAVLQNIPAARLKHLDISSISKLSSDSQTIVLEKLVDSGYLSPSKEMKLAYPEIWEMVKKLSTVDSIDDPDDASEETKDLGP